jgi:hypothetical protein
MKAIITKICDWIDGKLRCACYKLSIDTRIAVVLLLLISFGGLSIYMTVSSIYNIGKRDAKLVHIEHIKQLELQNKNDSINFLKQQIYEQSTE